MCYIVDSRSSSVTVTHVITLRTNDDDEGAAVDNLGEPVVSKHVVRLFDHPEKHTHPDGHRPLPANPQDNVMKYNVL